MEQSELLRFVAGSLEKLGIRYFVTGSMATIFFGEPSTHAWHVFAAPAPGRGFLEAQANQQLVHAPGVDSPARELIQVGPDRGVRGFGGEDLLVFCHRAREPA